jgi:hypothetical protein
MVKSSMVEAYFGGVNSTVIAQTSMRIALLDDLNGHA